MVRWTQDVTKSNAKSQTFLRIFAKWEQKEKNLMSETIYYMKILLIVFFFLIKYAISTEASIFKWMFNFFIIKKKIVFKIKNRNWWIKLLNLRWSNVTSNTLIAFQMILLTLIWKKKI
jgi:hypothetical protein